MHDFLSTFSAEQQLFAGLQSKLQCMHGLLMLSFHGSSHKYVTNMSVMHVNQVILVSVRSCGVVWGTGAFMLERYELLGVRNINQFLLVKELKSGA